MLLEKRNFVDHAHHTHPLTPDEGHKRSQKFPSSQCSCAGLGLPPRACPPSVTAQTDPFWREFRQAPASSYRMFQKVPENRL